MSMREFDDVDTMWAFAVGDILKHGKPCDSRNGASREIIGYSAKLLDVQRNFLVNEARSADPRYACAELLWYLSRSNDTTMLQAYAPSYKNYTEDGRVAYGAYGHRIATLASQDQLELAVEKLREPNTRQCVVSLWRAEDLATTSKDHPCTLTWQFLPRDNLLHMVVNMRSNDAWLGFPYDVFCFTCVQMLVAGTLGIGLGSYTHNVGSMHLYDENLEAARRAATLKYAPTPAHEWKLDEFDRVPMYVENECMTRVHGESSTIRCVASPTCLTDAYRCCASKFGVLGARSSVSSPALVKGLENVNMRRPGPSRQDDASPQTSN